jgi:hypothetical protein
MVPKPDIASLVDAMASLAVLRCSSMASSYLLRLVAAASTLIAFLSDSNLALSPFAFSLTAFFFLLMVVLQD